MQGEEGYLFGITRRYPAGLRYTKETEGRSPSFRIVDVPVDIPPIRLLEQDAYDFTCCKSCRGDFLNLLGSWSRGEKVRRLEPDDVHRIPFRENGAIIYLSEAEFERRRRDREDDETE